MRALLTNKESIITDAVLSKSRDKLKRAEILTLSLSFRVSGEIREIFDQKNWERAYNKHDNVFRMSIEVDLRSGRKVILPLKFARKAVLFWTRSPKIPYRIWVLIIKDDTTFYPSNVEEAQSMLFDINKLIEVNANALNLGSNSLFTEIKVKWGDHHYTHSNVVSARSNIVQVTCTT
jgi:hypothetical protein